MIHGNLATRPFYNERAVRTWLFLAALMVGAATLFNVTRIIRYLRDDSELARQATLDTTRAAEARAEAARLRASVDAKQIALISVEALAANELIDRRTFSWTALLNTFERTLPDQVRITSVRPEDGRARTDHAVWLTVAVVARGVDDMNQFMENLEATGAFSDLLAREEHMNDDGQLEATLEAAYRPPAPAEPPPPGASR